MTQIQTAEHREEPKVTFTRVRVARTIADRHATIAWIDGALAAVLVRLDDEAHGEFSGHWFLEIGFGNFDVTPPLLFASLLAAEQWVVSIVREMKTEPAGISD